MWHDSLGDRPGAGPLPTQDNTNTESEDRQLNSAWGSNPQSQYSISRCTDLVTGELVGGYLQVIQVSLKSDKKTGTLHEHQYICMITSPSILLRIRNVSDKSCKENQNKFYVK
jgi:hypothetical protein